MEEVKVEKNNIIANKIASLRKIKNKEYIINGSIGNFEYIITPRKNKDWKNIIEARIIIKPRNFPIIKSYLFIGLDNIRYIVFHSISLKSNWLQIKTTEISQKISIIDNPKSSTIFSVCPNDNEAKARLKIINKIAKNIIR